MRNPDRMWDFLSVLKKMEGLDWNHDTQMEYHSRLIQDRYYNPTPRNLSEEQQYLLSDPEREISLREAIEIFHAKGYKDSPMRGRNSASPLKKFGLATFDGEKVAISELGNLFLQQAQDLSDLFLRMLLKWQIPNPDNKSKFKPDLCDIKPFIGTLHLIQQVNEREESNGRTAKGISRRELSVFVPTLIHHRDIGAYAERIVDLRTQIKGLPREEQEAIFESHARSFVGEFFDTSDRSKVDRKLATLRDYGDNTIRFFRMTRYIHIRGGGFYVDLEPYRNVQINTLLGTDDGAAAVFDNRRKFLEYIVDPETPELPWETIESQIEILNGLEATVHDYEVRLNLPLRESVDVLQLDVEGRKERIDQLTERRRDLQDLDRYQSAQNPESIQECIKVLDGIHSFNDRPILLERTAALCLCALNDAEVIRPMYPVGDDNEPTNTAPGNTPDIECFYEVFNAICEVTMLTRRDQWYNEGQPVMRHLRDFEDRNEDKPAYCLFVAPKIHRDTANTFFMHTKFSYEGRPLKIVPLTIGQLTRIMRSLWELRVADRYFSNHELRRLFDDVVSITESTDDSRVWLKKIPEVIEEWTGGLAS